MSHAKDFEMMQASNLEPSLIVEILPMFPKNLTISHLVTQLTRLSTPPLRPSSIKLDSTAFS